MVGKSVRQIVRPFVRRSVRKSVKDEGHYGGVHVGMGWQIAKFEFLGRPADIYDAWTPSRFSCQLRNGGRQE